MRKSKTTLKHRGGLVQGTGRLRPNGTIKRTNSKTSIPQPALVKPAAPVKTRLVIDQGPTPLYCSDECQMADYNSLHSNYPHDFNPVREPARTDTSPSRVFSISSSTSTDSESSSASSSSSLPPSASTPKPTPYSPSLAKLAEMYNFPPLPPPAPTYDEKAEADAKAKAQLPYSGGIIMAGRYMASIFSKPVAPQAGRFPEPATERPPVPGWTDGSNGWRSLVYGLSHTPKDPESYDAYGYRSCVASPHRSSRGASPTSNPPVQPARNAVPSIPSDHDMVNRFSESFRQAETRAMTSSPKSRPSGSKRERSLLQPGAEGKLLVPDVKMRVHSSASLSSAYSAKSSSSKRSVRSPLSVSSVSSSDFMQDAAGSMPTILRRPKVEGGSYLFNHRGYLAHYFFRLARSWSYDNSCSKTYPIMPIPEKREKRMERQTVNGVQVDVEVEVLLEPKKLFNFAPTMVYPSST